MAMHRNLLTILLILSVTSLYSQRREEYDIEHFSREISIQRGVMGSFRGSGESVFTGYNTNIEYAQFGDEHWGYRTGISLTDSYPGCKMQYTIPFRLVYRTFTHQAADPQLEFFSFEDFFVSVINIFPWHVEFNGGLSLGYAQPQSIELNPITHKPIESDYYKVNNNVVLSFDLGLRYNVHLGRMNLFVAPQFSYQPTRNFVYYSQNGDRKEYERAFFGGVSGGVGFRF